MSDGVFTSDELDALFADLEDQFLGKRDVEDQDPPLQRTQCQELQLEEEEGLPTKSSRNRAKGWFLTYPKCPLEPEQVLAHFRSMPFAIKDYCIAKEDHKDGSHHIHAFIRYKDKVEFKPDRWDIGQYHGNYQAAKNWKGVLQYCQKEGNYISNFDPDAAKSKRAARNKQIVTEDPKKLVDEGIIPIDRLPNIMKAIDIYHLLEPAEDMDTCRGIWIYGPPGVGKSHVVRTLFPRQQLYIKAQNKWFDGYRGQTVMLVDDFDLQGKCLSHYLKLWADKWSASGEIKGYATNLHHRLIIITSNYSIGQVFPENEDYYLHLAIKRRFSVIHMQQRDDSDSIRGILRERYDSAIKSDPVRSDERYPPGGIPIPSLESGDD